MQKCEAYSFIKPLTLIMQLLSVLPVILGRYLLCNHCNEPVKSDTTLHRKD